MSLGSEPGNTNSGSSRPCPTPGSCLQGRVVSSLVPRWAAARAMATWGLPNYSVFHWQPQTEPFVASPGPQRPPAPARGWERRRWAGFQALHWLGSARGSGAPLGPQYPCPWSGPSTPHGYWHRGPREGWLSSRPAPSPASLALTPAPACMPPGPESSLPPFQQLGWLEPQAPHSGLRMPPVSAGLGGA